MRRTARLGVLLASLPGCDLVFGVDGRADANLLDCAGDEVVVDVDVVRLQNRGDGGHVTLAEVVEAQYQVSVDGAPFVAVDPDAMTGDLRFCRDPAGAPYRLRSLIDGSPFLGEIHAASAQIQIGRVLFGRAGAMLEGAAPAALTIDVSPLAEDRAYALRTTGVFGTGPGQTLAANQAAISLNWDQLAQPTWPRRVFDASVGDRLYYLHYDNAILTRIGDISAGVDGGEIDLSGLTNLSSVSGVDLTANVFDFAGWQAALPATSGDTVAGGTTIAGIPEPTRAISPAYPLAFALSATAPGLMTFPDATDFDPELDTIVQSSVNRMRIVNVQGHPLQLGAQFFALALVDALPSMAFELPEFPAVSFAAVNLASLPDLGVATGLDPSVDQALVVSGFPGGSGRTLSVQVMEVVFPERPGSVALLTPVFISTYGQHPGPLLVPAGTMQPGRRYVIRSVHRAGTESDATGAWTRLTYPLSQTLIDTRVFQIPTI